MAELVDALGLGSSASGVGVRVPPLAPNTTPDKGPYRSLSSYLKQTFGLGLGKITIDAGLSCPNRDGAISCNGCVYCNPKGSGTGLAAKMDVARQISVAKEKPSPRFPPGAGFIAYFQAYTNTHAPIKRLTEIYRPALEDDDVKVVAIGTRPDCLGREVLELLAEINRQKPLWLELGLQSADDHTLELINRGHTAAVFADAAVRAAELGILVCAHVIIGLPGEDGRIFRKTARFLARLPVSMVKLHSLYVAQNTALADWYRAGRFTPLTRDQFVEGAIDFLQRLHRDTVIARLTGDPAPGELVAPGWAADKHSTIQAIRRTMTKNGLRQGDLHAG